MSAESLAEARPLTRNPLGQSHGNCDSCCSGCSCGGCSSCDSCQSTAGEFPQTKEPRTNNPGIGK